MMSKRCLFRRVIVRTWSGGEPSSHKRFTLCVMGAPDWSWLSVGTRARGFEPGRMVFFLIPGPSKGPSPAGLVGSSSGDVFRCFASRSATWNPTRDRVSGVVAVDGLSEAVGTGKLRTNDQPGVRPRKGTRRREGTPEIDPGSRSWRCRVNPYRFPFRPPASPETS